MKTYTIIGGVNGVGKSSFTGLLREQRTDLGTIIDVDRLTAQLGGDTLAGGRAAVGKIRACLQAGVSFTQETTLSGHKTAATAKQAQEQGYHVRLYYIALESAQESVERIANRVRHGGHAIADKDVIRRFGSRWEAVAAVLPYCDEAEFYDNSNGFQKAAEYRNGEIRPVGQNHPAWLRELIEQDTTHEADTQERTP